MSDRDCKHCKHQKADGCSRWDCEYEPVMSDLIKKSDAIKALYKYNFVSKDVIEREINGIPSADVVEVVRCENCIFYEKALSVQGFCHNHGSIVSANAFCSYGSYGKRREDGEA